MATHSRILAWKSHGQRSLAGNSSWGQKESDTTEQLHFTLCHCPIEWCFANNDKACLRMVMRMLPYNFQGQASKRLGVWGLSSLWTHVCTVPHSHTHAFLISETPFPRGHLDNAWAHWNRKRSKAMGQLHHGNPTLSQTSSLANQTWKLSPNSAPWQSQCNHEPRDKRSRNPREIPNVFFRAISRLHRGSAQTPAEKNILLAGLHLQIRHHFRESQPRTLWDLIF